MKRFETDPVILAAMRQKRKAERTAAAVSLRVPGSHMTPTEKRKLENKVKGSPEKTVHEVAIKALLEEYPEMLRGGFAKAVKGIFTCDGWSSYVHRKDCECLDEEDPDPTIECPGQPRTYIDAIRLTSEYDFSEVPIIDVVPDLYGVDFNLREIGVIEVEHCNKLSGSKLYTYAELDDVLMDIQWRLGVVVVNASSGYRTIACLPCAFIRGLYRQDNHAHNGCIGRKVDNP